MLKSFRVSFRQQRYYLHLAKDSRRYISLLPQFPEACDPCCICCITAYLRREEHKADVWSDACHKGSIRTDTTAASLSIIPRVFNTMGAVTGKAPPSTLIVKEVMPLDGNATIVTATESLDGLLPPKTVELIREFAVDPRYIEEATPEPQSIVTIHGDGSLSATASKKFKQIQQTDVVGETRPKGPRHSVPRVAWSCLFIAFLVPLVHGAVQTYVQVVARYKNGLRRTVNPTLGSSIYLCSTGQAFEDLDTAMSLWQAAGLCRSSSLDM